MGNLVLCGTKPVIFACREARAEPDFDRNIDGHGLVVSTILCVPVIDSHTKEVVAVFQNLNKRRAYFDREDEAHCEKCAMHASVLLSNAKHHDTSLAIENRMYCLTKHMKFLSEARGSLLRFVQASLESTFPSNNLSQVHLVWESKIS